MIRIWGCIWWQEIVGGPPVTGRPQSLLSNPPTIGWLHSSRNWWDKTAGGRDKTADLRQIRERWVNFCHSTAERWSGSTGKKRARKTARSFQREKEIGKTQLKHWRQKETMCAKAKAGKSVHSFLDNWGKTLFCSNCNIYLKLTFVSLSQLYKEKVKRSRHIVAFVTIYNSHSSIKETHIVILMGWHPLQIGFSLSSRVSPSARNLTLKEKFGLVFLHKVTHQCSWSHVMGVFRGKGVDFSLGNLNAIGGKPSSSPPLHHSWSTKGCYSWWCR